MLNFIGGLFWHIWRILTLRHRGEGLDFKSRWPALLLIALAALIQLAFGIVSALITGLVLTFLLFSDRHLTPLASGLAIATIGLDMSNLLLLAVFGKIPFTLMPGISAFDLYGFVAIILFGRRVGQNKTRSTDEH